MMHPDAAKIAQIESDVRHHGTEIATIRADIRGLRDEVGDAKEEILNRLDQAKRDARFNWAPVGILATIIGVVVTAALTAMLWGLTQYNAQANELNRVRAELGDKIAGVRIDHVTAEGELTRADIDEFRRVIADNHRQLSERIDAAMASIGVVNKTLTWLQGQFESESKMRDWQADLYRDFDVNPKTEPNR